MSMFAFAAFVILFIYVCESDPPSTTVDNHVDNKADGLSYGHTAAAKTAEEAAAALKKAEEVRAAAKAAKEADAIKKAADKAAKEAVADKAAKKGATGASATSDDTLELCDNLSWFDWWFWQVPCQSKEDQMLSYLKQAQEESEKDHDKEMKMVAFWVLMMYVLAMCMAKCMAKYMAKCMNCFYEDPTVMVECVESASVDDITLKRICQILKADHLYSRHPFHTMLKKFCDSPEHHLSKDEWESLLSWALLYNEMKDHNFPKNMAAINDLACHFTQEQMQLCEFLTDENLEEEGVDLQFYLPLMDFSWRMVGFVQKRFLRISSKPYQIVENI